MTGREVFVHQGPIPARAGEPRGMSIRFPDSRAYPRAGGGTVAGEVVARLRVGLSPRGRGNLRVSIGCNTLDGPIPARAGEPQLPRVRMPKLKAYPRAGGGTATLPPRPRDARGLSPRGRGNLMTGRHFFIHQRPIPARAGEPTTCTTCRTTSGAYPRAGGGTAPMECRAASFMGLSPRGRGNHILERARCRQAGPIPARAGEPGSTSWRRNTRRAYPRAGGGTGIYRIEDYPAGGLSPRGRGNPCGP